MKVRQKTWIGELIEYYKIVDGEWFGERKHWMQDDYVKFIRFAQWKIDQVGEGVLGFITNHAYLDNPTFRGMCQSLMNSFDEIHILDLHGNTLKKERAPDGSEDKNVFDIQQGVAIALFLKHKSRTNECRIFHSDVWGPRDYKNDFLESHDFKTVKHTEIRPSSPYYFFVPQQQKHKTRYDSYPQISEIFETNSVGVVTGRDHFNISFSKEEMWPRILNFVALEIDMARVAYALGNDSRDWTVATALEDVRKSGPNKNFIKELLFRPFDWRFTYYTGNSRGVYSSPQSRIMTQFLLSNLGLVVPKRVETKAPWCNAYVTNSITDHVAVSLKTIDYCFPLFTHQEASKRDLFSQNESGKRMPNLSLKLTGALKSSYKYQPSPEDIFYYIYALLYSNAYRKKYAEFLKTDFPRVPFTKNRELFSKLAEKGEELVELHLVKSKRLVKPIAKCEGSGNLRVDRVTYDQDRQRVHINPEKWFARVPSEVWEYHIGGYQVSEKWLKDRKGRELSSEEVTHYARVVTAIAETIKIQQSLDDLFKEVETNLLEISI